MATQMTRKTLEIRWAGQEALEAATRDTGVDVTDGAARLARRVVIADETGDCTGRDVEVLRGPVQARKLFHLAPVDRGAARARLSAWLRCAPADAVLVADVNGHEVRFSRSPRGRPDDAGTPDYWHANWLTVDLDPAWLLPGENAVTLRAHGGSTWELLIETCRHPDRSAKSRDGGATWDSAHLGWNDCYDGEYLVRLELERHPARGWIAGPETDLSATAAGDALGAPTRILGAVAVAEGDVPDGTAVDLELRAGPVPSFDPARWSPWKPADGWTARPGDRFLQWRATLLTNRPLVTPVLRAIEVRAEVETEPHRWGRLAGADNPPIVRPSHPVAFQRPYSRARMMRERWGLEAVVAGARDDLEAIERIACWTRDQWRDGWNPAWKALHACPPWDGPTILEFGRHDLGMGMCTHYATVFVHACASLGIPSRHLIHRSHCTGEAWSDRWGTWVWFDAGGDVDDATRAVYRVERDGVPLSALAAREAWFRKRLDGVRLVGRASGKFDLGTRLALLDRFCVVTRNDQMTAPHPGELEHGVVAYHYDGYLWWRDATVPPLPYLSRSSSRPGDFAWTPNRTRIHLQRTDRPGVVRVALETSMPGMDNEVTLGPGHHPGIIHVAADDAHGADLGSLGGVGGGTAPDRAHPAGFEIREGDGAWRAGEAEYDWTLTHGANRLEARSMNGFGVRGPAARVEVAFEGVRS